MSQTYTPGTILSIGAGPTLEQVIVLTDGRVATKTFAGNPVARREFMSLADWQLLAGSVKIQTDYLPLATSVPVAMAAPMPVAMAAPMPVPVAMPAPVAVAMAAPAPVAPAEKAYLPGTMLRWKKDDDNRRWAIVLKDGILQIKEVMMGRTSIDAPLPGRRYGKTSQKFFSSLADWKSTLPADGVLTATEATEDHSVPSIKRKAAETVNTATDYEYLKVLLKRFSVHSRLEKKLTDNEIRNSSFKTMQEGMVSLKKHMESLKDLSTDKNLTASRIQADLHSISWITKWMKRNSKLALEAQKRMMSGPSDQQPKESYRFENNYKQVLYGYIGDKKVEITSSNGLMGLAWDKVTNRFSKWAPPTTFKNFAEGAALGLKMKPNGKPFLTAYYRGKQIDI